MVQRVGGLADDGDAVALDRQWGDPDAEVDGRDGVLGELADLLYAGLGVGPAAV